MKTRSLVESFRCAAEGVFTVLRTERNMRIHFAVAVTVFAVAVALRVDGASLACLVVAVCQVLVAELVNTALENLCDVVSSAREAHVKVAKDIAAGGVLVSAAAAVAVGVAILGPRLAHAVRSLVDLM